MNRRMFLASLVMPVLAGCSARAPVRSTPDRYVRRGLASWYGDAFDGKPTASGEPFDSNQFTTAHYDLALRDRRVPLGATHQMGSRNKGRRCGVDALSPQGVALQVQRLGAIRF